MYVTESGTFYPIEFVIKNKAYVGFGYSMLDGADGYNNRNSLFQYDPVHNKWQQMPSVTMSNAPGVGYAFSFVLGTKAYTGGGFWVSIFENLHGVQRNAPRNFFQFSPQ
jgi:N-acetylneuraminic acid mutarotase